MQAEEWTRQVYWRCEFPAVGSIGTWGEVPTEDLEGEVLSVFMCVRNYSYPSQLSLAIPL